MKKIELKSGFDELAFLELFLAEPKFSTPEDGYWCYEACDEFGLILKFGVDIIQYSIQIELKISGITIAILSFEAIETIEIDESGNYLSFSLPTVPSHLKTQIKVEVRPQIKISGASLKIS